MYSFRDLLALRTFVHLRQDASLQKIRTAISNLRDLGELDHLAAYRLVSDSRGNIQLIQGEDAAIDLVRHPGQAQLLVVIGDVLEPFPVRPGVVVPHLLRPRAHLSVDPDTKAVPGNRRNCAFPTQWPLMRENVPAEKIADYYPSVEPAAAHDALDFAMYVDSYGRAA